ncbi:glycosyltransferase family 4 protein [Candidatus Uhrbacteria bacterium]|nr:glycosyltransferase family 4 protein [Candidatus Uhrbacteria bacterium]
MARILAGSPFLLYVGNAYPHKNLETLLSAFSLFHKSHPNVHLVLSGRGDVFYERLQKEVGRLNLENHVRFVLNPTDQDLAALYRQASVYVFPSKCEGFGLPPLEAMSFGVPVAASNTSSLPEILGEAAVYFDPKDPEKITQAIRKVFEDPSLQETLRKKAFEQIKRYSWKKMAEQILHVYDSCDQKETS